MANLETLKPLPNEDISVFDSSLNDFYSSPKNDPKALRITDDKASNTSILLKFKCSFSK